MLKMGENKRIEKERNEHMEQILSQILGELKNSVEEMRDTKLEIREVKQEIREMKEVNRQEHEEMKQDIAEIKEEQKEMKHDITENGKSIKEATDFIIETVRSIEKTITNNHAKQMRQLMLVRNVTLGKDKSQDAVLALHDARIKKCEDKIAELLN